jgi:hypothetical protein
VRSSRFEDLWLDKQPFPARRASNNAIERRYRAPVPLIR